MTTSTNRLLRRPEVINLVGLKTSAIYDMMARGEFPRPVRVGSRAVAWRLSDLEAWMAARETA